MYFQGFCPRPPELIELNQAVLAILPFRSRWAQSIWNEYFGISGKGAYIGPQVDHPILWLLPGHKGVPCGSIGPQVARAQIIWSAGRAHSSCGPQVARARLLWSAGRTRTDLVVPRSHVHGSS